jgi:hypothetical protein
MNFKKQMLACKFQNTELNCSKLGKVHHGQSSVKRGVPQQLALLLKGKAPLRTLTIYSLLSRIQVMCEDILHYQAQVKVSAAQNLPSRVQNAQIEVTKQQSKRRWHRNESSPILRSTHLTLGNFVKHVKVPLRFLHLQLMRL